MAGPRSRGCGLCKIRKIKCDEKWPVCSPCYRKSLSCPGPAPWVSVKGKGGPPRGSDVVIRPRPSGPRPAPSSPGDRVAAQLVSHMTAAADNGNVIQARYLGELPKRLAQHQSLRDSVRLFYIVRSNFLLQKPSVELTCLPDYGKAIQSLRQILASTQARTPETLASVTILHLIEELFNPSPHRMLHAAGMTSLVTAIGPPKPDDQFYISILCEVYNVLIPHAIMKGWKDSRNAQPWRDPLGVSWSQSSVNEELKQYMLPTLQACGDVADRMSVFVRGCQALWKPATAKYLGISSAEIGQEIGETAEKMDALLSTVVTECLERGEMNEDDDPRSISGTSYRFSNPFLAYTLLHTHCSHVGLCRMRHYWSEFHDWPDVDIQYAKLRDLCVHIWKYVRFLRGLEPSAAAATPRGLFFTLEVADTDQKNRLLDEFSELDKVLGKIPTPREVMEGEIIFFTKLLTGRKP